MEIERNGREEWHLQERTKERERLAQIGSEKRKSKGTGVGISKEKTLTIRTLKVGHKKVQH